MSVLKIKDGNSWINIPAGGVGVPSGGNQGDVLVKSSATDYATEWFPRLKYTTITETYTIAGNSDKRITLQDLKDLFDASYTGEILAAFPVTGAQPLLTWGTQPFVEWEENNQCFSIHAQGSTQQSYVMLWGFLYY